MGTLYHSLAAPIITAIIILIVIVILIIFIVIKQEQNKGKIKKSIISLVFIGIISFFIIAELVNIFHDKYNETKEKYKYITTAQNKAAKFKEQENYNEAIEVWKDLLEENPDDAQLHYELAKLYYETEQYRDVVKECETAVELDDRDADYYNLLGAGLYELGLYEEAYGVHKDAFKMKEETSYHLNIAKDLYAMKKYDEACEIYKDESEHLNTENISECINYALSLNWTGNYEAALMEFQAIMDKVYTDDIPIYIEMVELEIKMSEESDNTDLLFELGQIYCELGFLDESYKIIDHIGDEEEKALYLCKIGKYLVSIGQPHEAELFFADSVMLEINDQIYHDVQGMMLLDEHMDNIEQDVQLYMKYAYEFMELGNYNRAEELLNLADQINIDKNFQIEILKYRELLQNKVNLERKFYSFEAHQLLADSYQKLDFLEEADKEYKIAERLREYQK